MNRDWTDYVIDKIDTLSRDMGDVKVDVATIKATVSSVIGMRGDIDSLDERVRRIETNQSVDAAVAKSIATRRAALISAVVVVLGWVVPYLLPKLFVG